MHSLGWKRDVFKPTTGGIGTVLAFCGNLALRGDGSVDLIACNLVLEHIEDLPFIFSECSRSLRKDGRLFVCELHPFRQYQGTRAKFQANEGEREIDAFVHNISDYLHAAAEGGFELEHLKEWWHEDDQGKPPRLISFMFKSRGRQGNAPWKCAPVR